MSKNKKITINQSKTRSLKIINLQNSCWKFSYFILSLFLSDSFTRTMNNLANVFISAANNAIVSTSTLFSWDRLLLWVVAVAVAVVVGFEGCVTYYMSIERLWYLFFCCCSGHSAQNDALCFVWLCRMRLGLLYFSHLLIMWCKHICESQWAVSFACFIRTFFFSLSQNAMPK